MMFHSRRSVLAMLAVAPLAASPLGVLAETPIMRVTSSLNWTSGRTVRLDPSDGSVERVIVTAMSADPRGELLAVAGDDHVIRILEMASMTLREELREHRDMIRTLAFDRDGDKLVSAGNDGQLIVWQRGETFEPRQSMQNTPAIACARFSPSGRIIAAVGFASDIYILGKDGADLPHLSCECNDLRAVAFRDDGELLAVGGRSGELHLFSMRTGELVKHVTIHEGRIRDMAFGHGSNNLVSVGEDSSVIVYDTSALTEKHRVELPGGRCFSIAVIDSQHVAVAGSDNLIRIVNTDEGRIVSSLTGHDGSVSSLVGSGGVLFSGGFDATIRRWMVGSASGGDRIAETEAGLGDKK